MSLAYDLEHMANLELTEKIDLLLFRFRARMQGKSNILREESGRNRIAFLTDRYVIKIPLNVCGVDDNYWEHHKSDPLFARTRLAVYDSLPIIFMERLNTDIPIDELPDWSLSIDCQQVGYDKHGMVKAYDYGYH